MQRRIALLVVVSAMALGAPAATDPALAHTEVCAGPGRATVSAPFGYSSLGDPSATANFGVNLASLGCVPSLDSVTFHGTIQGWCENTVGSGSVDGHQFTMIGTGFKFVLQGQMTGTLNIDSAGLEPPCVPHPLDGFHATSAFTLTH